MKITKFSEPQIALILKQVSDEALGLLQVLERLIAKEELSDILKVIAPVSLCGGAGVLCQRSAGKKVRATWEGLNGE